MSQNVKPWRRRWEIPDAQIRDAADQYEAARKLLAMQPPFSGVLLPLINVAAVAIELYLKCLSAELVHTPDEDFPGCFIVSAAPTRWGHKLAPLFAEISDNLKRDLENAFQTERPNVAGRTFLETLKRCEGAFAESRYPFEHDKDISKYPLNDLMFISEFLSGFVSKLSSKEYIEW
ncbi:MAG TPA: hypothetical protein VEF04_22925 [Blastocatellia bacterium]|nr:hypothetical protein [Blastocatellia bacterium]